MNPARRLFSVLLAVGLLLSAAACSADTADRSIPKTQRSALQIPEGEPIRAAASYEEVRTQLLKQDTVTNRALLTDGTAEVALENGQVSDAEENYSGTNIQVDGVDEADVIKTDGRYIYALFGSLLQIIRADGESTAVTGEIRIEATDEEDLYPHELFVDGTTLWVLAQKTVWDDEASYWGWKNQTALLVYDVSDPSAPRLTGQLGQDGSYTTSRMTDGRLYLITENYLYDELSEDSDTWIPRTYCDGADAKLPPENIYLCPDFCRSAFTLIGVYDCKAQSLSDVCSFTGGADCVYMSRDSVYIAQTSARELSSDPYTESQYTVTDYQNTTVTQLHRIRAVEGRLTPDGSATVSGSLLNQFSMDEYDGMLRLAVTTRSSSYSVYRDEAYDFENYRWNESEQNNAVIVLDGDMKPLGELTDLVADERIYSVRFMGETAYIVTYEQIDPVFTVDLSDPKKPTVQSSLEVLGVSDYLHSYGDGLLFGFGEALDTDAVSAGLQLSMFDTSDPKNVRLLDKTVLEEKYSEALHNHKAMLISTEKNLIAFPDRNGCFYVYSFTNGSFLKMGSFSFDTPEDDFWGLQTVRGLYIGDALYILSEQSLYVVSLTDFATLAQISFAEG